MGAGGHGRAGVIAPCFGDIFYSNCFQNGLLPVALPLDEVEQLADEIAPRRATRASPSTSRTAGRVAHGPRHPVPGRCAAPHAMLNGLDDIAQTMTRKDEVAAWQTADKSARPWVWL